MGDNSMRTKEQVEACLELFEAKTESMPKDEKGKVHSSYVERHNYVLGISRILKWVLRRRT